MVQFEDGPAVVTIPHTFELFRNTLHTGDKHTAKRLFLFQMTIAPGIKTSSLQNIVFFKIPGSGQSPAQ
jgi:hypothetical protein